jgi:23S rRNA G2445 N2-methylase RlmL
MMRVRASARATLDVSIVIVVQTNERIVERCLLMATDPGDLVLDPTCGSGTTSVRGGAVRTPMRPDLEHHLNRPTNWKSSCMENRQGSA